MVPVAVPRATPVNVESPCLRGLGTSKRPTCLTSTVPSGLSRDGLAPGAEHGVAELVDQRAVGAGLERAVARVPVALRGPHREPALALDGEVERLVGLLERALA